MIISRAYSEEMASNKIKLRSLESQLLEFNYLCTHTKIDNLSAIDSTKKCTICKQENIIYEEPKPISHLEIILQYQIKIGNGISAKLITDIFLENPNFVLPENLTIYGGLILNNPSSILTNGLTIYGDYNTIICLKSLID